MKRVSDALEAEDGRTRTEIRSAVKGKNESIDMAIDALIREGYIRIEEGARGSLHHHLIEPFTDRRKPHA